MRPADTDLAIRYGETARNYEKKRTQARIISGIDVAVPV